jgi:hypothetical protein
MKRLCLVCEERQLSRDFDQGRYKRKRVRAKDLERFYRR